MAQSAADGPSQKNLCATEFKGIRIHLAACAAAGIDRDFNCHKCRWGDYSSATPDPAARASAATGVVWGANQWQPGSLTKFDRDWRTWIWVSRP